jgi:putative transposase
MVMPDHVHALVWFPETGQLSACMQSWKRRSCIGLWDWYRQVSSNYVADFGEGDRFWRPKYQAFEIDERKKLEEKLQYMHENPVRAILSGSRKGLSELQTRQLSPDEFQCSVP